MNSGCKVCEFGPEYIDWAMSNVAIAEIVDCSETSVRRHRKHSEEPEARMRVASDPRNAEVPGSWIPRRRWTMANGEEGVSEQFVPDSPEDVHVDNNRIDSLIRDWPMKTLPQKFEPISDMAFPADLQLGKAGERLGGTPETLHRFQKSIEALADRWERIRPEHGYLCDMGDLVENMFSTPQQVSTNDRTLPEQIEDAVAAYMNAIGRLRPLVKHLHHATVTSNHGEARNAPKTNPYNSENDWGLHIQRVIQGKCEDRGWGVQFHRPGYNQDTTVLEISDGTKVALNHGHHSNNPKKVVDWVGGQIIGRRPGWDADLWVFGHYHHSFHQPIGDDRMVFGTPALDGGSEWWSRKTGESSDPGLMMMTPVGNWWENYTVYKPGC